ncbi:MAG: hypothetical protein KDI10_06770 [Halioglobus sp.]|nr:hypothetical protein [Halioglobus sp.]
MIHYFLKCLPNDPKWLGQQPCFLLLPLPSLACQHPPMCEEALSRVEKTGYYWRLRVNAKKQVMMLSAEINQRRTCLQEFFWSTLYFSLLSWIPKAMKSGFMPRNVFSVITETRAANARVQNSVNRSGNSGGLFV